MRVRKWQERLIDALNEELMLPFSWKNAHCLDLMLCSVKAVLGDNHPVLKKNFHGTEEECIAWLDSKEVGGLEGIFAAYFAEIPWGWAQDGDVGVFDLHGVKIGVVIVDGVGKAKADNGRIHNFPIDTLERIYKVE